MWTSSPQNNVRDVFDTPVVQKYNKLFKENQFRSLPNLYNDRLLDHNALPYIDLTMAPYYMPVFQFSFPNKRYLSFLLMPLLINKIKLCIVESINTDVMERIEEYCDYSIVFVNDGARLSDEYVPHNNFTTLLGKETYLYKDKHIVVKCSEASDHSYSIKHIHKYISILAGLVHTYEEELPYHFDYKIYEQLFNYDILNFFASYEEFVGTFYNAMCEEDNNRAAMAAVRYMADNNTSASENNIVRLENSISQYETELAEMYRQLRTERIMYNANKYANKDEKIKEFMHMFNTCRNLKEVELTQDGYNRIWLHFVCPLINYDKELAEEWCKNTSNPFADAEVQDLMYKLLCSGKYTVLFDAEVLWDICSNHITNYNNYSFGAAPYLVQPHIMYYNCFGDNKHIITEQLTMRNFDIALDATDAALSSLNILDTAVLNKFISDVKHRHNAIVKNNETGELITIEEVIADDTIVKPGA